MDEVTRFALTSRVERHHPSPIWGWLHISCCAVCRLRWPCPAYRDALRTLRISPGRTSLGIPRRARQSGQSTARAASDDGGSSEGPRTRPLVTPGAYL